MRRFFALSVLVLSLGAAWCVFAQTKLSDVLPTLTAFERPQFPSELRAAGVRSGYAIAAFSILQGHIDDVVILEASNVEFGDAVLAVVPNWRFKVTEVTDDVPLPHREVLRFEFSLTGVVTSISHRDAEKKLFPATDPLPIRTVTRLQLATPPERIAAPTEIKARGVPGSALVSFIIDSEGRVRVPIVLEMSRPDLGAAALAIVKQWRFSPSLYQGAPVLVEDQRSLNFAAKP